jgi:hypothetical protein
MPASTRRYYFKRLANEAAGDCFRLSFCGLTAESSFVFLVDPAIKLQDDKSLEPLKLITDISFNFKDDTASLPAANMVKFLAVNMADVQPY